MLKVNDHPKIAPSLLAADFAALKEEVLALEHAGADWLHWDVMDGHYVPNLTFGPMVVKALRPVTRLPFDVHLMIQPVMPFIKAFADAGADFITFHPEASTDPLEDIRLIKSLGKKAGLSLNPETSLETVLPFLEMLDLILIMTVSPGFGGQSFKEEPLLKMAELRRLIDQKKLSVLLSVDGGIGPQTAQRALTHGADVLVAGTSILSHKNHYKKAIDALRHPFKDA
ncbi:MAG: ribulose-phosphate 3-epimerase [Alphaproteobacteria bacterium 16-39-46]|nr:MAG: ribulose-phosphate 3-epimerase [Alphaproteobacteria bacterium 16-39-46]OZA42578.1 MAG: ribulose-phosphate 3-epimerase [Alphaproteobacteria bacterium 17-39-52]HQS84162.1 ribulose-phosphate 3-epimerase [Alphaproteobacteria bacterium]HQS94023.1 ribulose-phosphate 3-epimerase [Alphaproteobacteria bacterium]